MYIWVLQCKKLYERCQGFLGTPDLHLGLINVEDWDIFCRKKKKNYCGGWNAHSKLLMCSSYLPLLGLCQCCHGDEGKQRKGMSVIQKPISHVCSLNRSAAEARHIETQKCKTEEQISNDFNPHLISWCDGPSHTHSRSPAWGSQGLNAACSQEWSWPPPHWEDLSHRLLQNTENKWIWPLTSARIRPALCNARSTVFSFQRFWNTHWFLGSLQFFFFFNFKKQRGWRDSKIWKWRLTV